MRTFTNILDAREAASIALGSDLTIRHNQTKEYFRDNGTMSGYEVTFQSAFGSFPCEIVFPMKKNITYAGWAYYTKL